MRLLDQIKYSLYPLGHLVKKSEEVSGEYKKSSDLKEETLKALIRAHRAAIYTEEKSYLSELDREELQMEERQEEETAWRRYTMAVGNNQRIKEKYLAIRKEIKRRA